MSLKAGDRVETLLVLLHQLEEGVWKEISEKPTSLRRQNLEKGLDYVIKPGR
jgi:hypothetical protein